MGEWIFYLYLFLNTCLKIQERWSHCMPINEKGEYSYTCWVCDEKGKDPWFCLKFAFSLTSIASHSFMCVPMLESIITMPWQIEIYVIAQCRIWCMKVSSASPEKQRFLSIFKKKMGSVKEADVKAGCWREAGTEPGRSFMLLSSVHSYPPMTHVTVIYTSKQMDTILNILCLSMRPQQSRFSNLICIRKILENTFQF